MRNAKGRHLLAAEKDRRGLSVYGAAKELDISRSYLGLVLSGGANITLSMAKRIEKVWGIKASRLIADQLEVE